MSGTIIVAAAIAPALVSAGNVTLQALGTQTGTWSSNPLMQTNNPQSLWGSTTSPEIIVKDTTPRSLLSVDMRVDRNIFDQRAYNSTDLHNSNEIGTQNERWALSLQQKTDYDTTRTSEQTSYGQKSGSVRHTRLGFNPQISFSPTSHDKIAIEGSINRSTYDSVSYTNYQTYSVTPSYTHQFDPLNAGILSLQAQRYETLRDSSAQIDTLGPMIGWQRILTPRFTANGSIGAQTSQQKTFGVVSAPWAWQYTFAAGLTFKGQQDTLNLNATRQQFPYGNGTEALQTAFTTDNTHAINTRLDLKFGGYYRASTYPNSTSNNGPKDQMGGNLGFSYHATPQLDLTASYQYRRETETQSKLIAKDNAITIGLAFHPKLWTVLP